MLYTYLTIIRILIIGWCFLGWSFSFGAESNVNVLIIKDSNEDAYQQTIAGFKSALAFKNRIINFNELTYEKAKLQPTNLEHQTTTLVFALGESSLNWVRQQTSNIPIVATLVLKDSLLRQQPNITGVSLNYPLKDQFSWVKKFLPTQKKMAILFNPEENSDVIQRVQRLCRSRHLKLFAIPVKSAKELPQALAQLSNNIEFLMAIPDATVMTVNTAKEILLASFQNKIPLIGLSDNWVKSGALYALTWDYSDIGKQNANLARMILKGKSPLTILPERPRKTMYSVNKTVAERMNLHFSADILKNAKIVSN